MNASGCRLHRRGALEAAAVAGSALAGMRAVHAQGRSADTIRVGLVGAGGRGAGAAVQALSVAGSNVQLTAVADAFSERIAGSLQRIRKAHESAPEKVDVPEARRFVGLDAYRRVLDHCDLVILATPPGFRPFQFQAAVAAGKHVFLEKPVCVDAYGARLCLETAQQADAKNLRVGVGLQRRYEANYLEALAQVRAGTLGEIVGGQVYWNGPGIWYRGRKPDMTEMQFQVHNWYHFNWLCGDHICEQHVHNLDVANWFLDALPVSAYGVGGRQYRSPGQPSEIYDHHAVTFTYPGGVRIASQCRQFPGGEGRVEERFQGTKGLLTLRPGFAEITDRSGATLWKFSGRHPDPFQVEHDELQDAIRTGKPLNNAVYGTTSSFTSVLGRLATYSGREWDYAEALALDDRSMPEQLGWDATPPVLPDKTGGYPLPMPATFKVTSTTKPAVT
jgi:predicted dehydrogenase